MSVIDRTFNQLLFVRTGQPRWGLRFALLALLVTIAGWVVWQWAGVDPQTGSHAALNERSLASAESNSPALSHKAASSALRLELSAMAADPFSLPLIQAPALPPPVYVEPVVLAAPVELLPPPPSIKFTGVLRGVDGEVVVAAQWDDGVPVFLKAGDVLDNGYRVESISKQSVQMKHVQSLQVLVLRLPPSPKFEIR